MSNAPTVACPRCGAAASFTPENSWRPFCSERCKLIDLGHWASENYRVPDDSALRPDGEEPDDGAADPR